MSIIIHIVKGVRGMNIARIMCFLAFLPIASYGEEASIFYCESSNECQFPSNYCSSDHTNEFGIRYDGSDVFMIEYAATGTKTNPEYKDDPIRSDWVSNDDIVRTPNETRLSKLHSFESELGTDEEITTYHVNGSSKSFSISSNGRYVLSQYAFMIGKLGLSMEEGQCKIIR